MEKLKHILKTYKHGLIPIIYGIFYFALFVYLENRPISTFHMIRHPLDERIPFCEYFIIPYYLWFPYIASAVAAFVFLDKEKKDYTRLCIMLGVGMTFFLLFSYVYPNAISLRPTTITRDNIFVTLTKGIYSADTSTNVFPSIHCFNSLAVCTAIWHNKTFRKHLSIPIGSTVLCILIILSTMFVKQHSVIDVIGAFLMFLVLYVPLYLLPYYKSVRQSQSRICT